MQDGVRCVISEREAQHDGVGVRPGTVYVGRWCVGWSAGPVEVATAANTREWRAVCTAGCRLQGTEIN